MATTSAAGLTQLNDLLDEYLVKKAPALPTNAKDAIVRFAPWINLILIVIELPAILALLGLGAILTPFSYLTGVQMGLGYTIGMLFLIVSLAIQLWALPGLFKRTHAAWNLLYYSTLVHAVYSLLTYNWLNLILGTLIALYILFQVRDYYKA